MYKIDQELLEAGMNEALKISLNNLEAKMLMGSKSEIEVAVGTYEDTIKVAKTYWVSTRQYEDIFLSKEQELKDRWGITLK